MIDVMSSCPEADYLMCGIEGVTARCSQQQLQDQMLKDFEPKVYFADAMVEASKRWLWRRLRNK